MNNVYHFLGKETRICWSCGFPIMNNTSRHGNSCLFPDPKDGSKLLPSPCQKAKRIFIAAKNLAKDKAEGRKLKRQCHQSHRTKRKNESKVKLRKCIGVKCMDKPDKKRMFKSEGPFHRQCDRCRAAQGGIPLKQFKIDVKADLEFALNYA